MKSYKYITEFAARLVCLVFVLIPHGVMAQTPAPVPALAPVKALQIGILPTLSARVLIKNYHLVQVYLERELKRPVELTTAPDFRTFHFNTIEGKYDVVVTAAHLARLAQTEAKYAPLVCYKAANRAVLVEARDQPLGSIRDLKGKTLATGDRNALIVSQVLTYLQEQGLRQGIDYTLLETPTHSSAVYSAQSHASVLAVTSPSGFKNIPDVIKDNVKVFATLSALPSMMWMAHPRMASEVPALKAALLGFTDNVKEGRQFFEVTGYIGMRAITNDEMKQLEPYARDISGALRSGK